MLFSLFTLYMFCKTQKPFHIFHLWKTKIYKSNYILKIKKYLKVKKFFLPNNTFLYRRVAPNLQLLDIIEYCARSLIYLKNIFS